MKLKELNLMFFLFAVFFIFSCSAPVKPKPVGDNYHMCRFCKGTGILETRVSGDNYTIGETESEDSKILGGCLGFFFRPEKEEYENKKTAKDGYAYENRPYSIKKVKCVHCKGTGWVKDERNFLLDDKAIKDND